MIAGRFHKGSPRFILCEFRVNLLVSGCQLTSGMARIESKTDFENQINGVSPGLRAEHLSEHQTIYGHDPLTLTGEKNVFRRATAQATHVVLCRSCYQIQQRTSPLNSFANCVASVISSPIDFIAEAVAQNRGAPIALPPQASKLKR